MRFGIDCDTELALLLAPVVEPAVLTRIGELMVQVNTCKQLLAEVNTLLA